MSAVRIRLLRENAVLPKKATDGSAAYDLVACVGEPVTIQPGTTAVLPTGVAFCPEDPSVCALILSRSGLGVRGLSLANGVGLIDNDYRGEIHVALFNRTPDPMTVQPGDRVAQMLLISVPDSVLCEADVLPDTARGAGGFGSTGN